ncbi:MAG: sigma-54-dependent Fis family transcriptional regulator [Deltaproteobacteria bacterium]|nr:sigma-54-dependent Fis family transcriptional regulator [Deltaproteobacteria bacterium]
MDERPKVLVVDDEEPLRELLRIELTRSGCDVETAANGLEGLAKYGQEIYNVVLLDIRMPKMDGIEALLRMRRESKIPEIVMLTGHGTVESAVRCIQEGAYDYLTKPVKLDDLDRVIRRAYDRNRARIENFSLRLGARGPDQPAILGRSPAMRKVRDLIERLGPTDEPVLIQGESGTGKELAARALHEASGRADRPFVAVNCGRLDAHTAESELFGHVQGAFTGATKNRAGLFELAHTGTLFLDEVSEMALDVQVKLLRILETHTFRRLGGNHDIRVDVRFVFASNRDLARSVRAGSFREDLLHRINLLTIELPPLREREGDVELLAEHFLGCGSARELTGQARAALLAHAWPGNVRELKNVIRRSCILAETDRITPDLFPFAAAAAQPAAPAGDARPGPLWAVERDHIRNALAHTAGNKKAAAKLLEMNRKTLYAKIAKYGLEE